MRTESFLEPVAQCIGLTKVFRDFWGRDKVLAVDHLDLDVRPGEVFGLLGPNGSGKSTTIKMLLGLLYPTRGAARVLGRPPTDTAIKARIGFMPEESYLYRYLNAIETLDYYGRLFSLDRIERRRRTEQLIEMVGLKRAARRPVGTYSKGMARRIGLAQALINDPDFLILDEPTTGLDPVGTRQIKDVIQTLGARGKTVLLCSHLLADVEDVCDRVAIMYGGRLQAVGRVGDLLERRDVTEISARRIDDETIGRIKQIIAEAGSEVLGVHHPTDRLEALFLRVVGQAQRERIETSGAEGTVGVSEFLTGRGSAPSSESIVQQLVAAGRHTATTPIDRTASPASIGLAASSPRTDLLTKLTAVQPSPPPAPSKPGAPTPGDRPDEEVLDRLLKKPEPAPGGDQPPLP